MDSRDGFKFLARRGWKQRTVLVGYLHLRVPLSHSHSTVAAVASGCMRWVTRVAMGCRYLFAANRFRFLFPSCRVPLINVLAPLS
jgi:hypothetical protein